jgi:hypothetical protein
MQRTNQGGTYTECEHKNCRKKAVAAITMSTVSGDQDIKDFTVEYCREHGNELLQRYPGARVTLI